MGRTFKDSSVKRENLITKNKRGDSKKHVLKANKLNKKEKLGVYGLI